MSTHLSKFLLALVVSLTLTLSLAPNAQAGRDDGHNEWIPDPLGYASYQEQVSCRTKPMAGTVEFSRIIMRKFGGGSSGIVRACKVGGQSEHKEGRAFDWTLNANKAADRQRASKAIKWLTATVNGIEGYNAKQFGIMYVIWNGKMWRAYDADAGWQKYTGASAHRDHMHFSMNWAAAGKNSRYWKKKDAIYDFGPCVRVEGKLAAAWTKPRLVPCPEPLPAPR